MSAPALAAPALFGWGCLGGTVTAVAVYVLPELVHAHTAGIPLDLSAGRVWTFVGLAVAVIFVAGVVTLIPSHITSRGQAIEYGLGAQAILKGILSGAKEAVRPPSDDEPSG